MVRRPLIVSRGLVRGSERLLSSCYKVDVKRYSFLLYSVLYNLYFLFLPNLGFIDIAAAKITVLLNFYVDLKCQKLSIFLVCSFPNSKYFHDLSAMK